MPGYGIQPAEDGRGLLPWSWASERLQQARSYWIITVTPDGKPHAAPVWGLWFEQGFYFATGDRSQKAANLRVNASLVVHLESGDEVVILEGWAQGVVEEGLLRKLDQAYFAKYGVHMAGGSTYALLPEKAFAWEESDFPGTATRWQLAPDSSSPGA